MTSEKGEKKIITEKGRENGEKIGVVGKDQGPSFRLRSINRTYSSHSIVRKMRESENPERVVCPSHYCVNA